MCKIALDLEKIGLYEWIGFFLLEFIDELQAPFLDLLHS